MKAIFQPCSLKGSISAPPSKSMAHRYLIGAALCGKRCVLHGIDYSEDILATIDCLRALGAEIVTDGDEVTVIPHRFMQMEVAPLECRESGSTLRFLIPLCLCLGRPIVLKGSPRLLERPLDVYELLCLEHHLMLQKGRDSLTLSGNLQPGSYTVRGDVSSQFITGLLFALVYLGGESQIKILSPFESRSYVDLTLSALQAFGADVAFTDDDCIAVRGAKLHVCSGSIEGDYSNAAFLDAFNCIGSRVEVQNLCRDSLQGDRIYKEYFDRLQKGRPTLDLSDCPDLGPVLFALAALQNGAVFTGTDRLKAKESDRGTAMHEELKKLGGGLVFGDNRITVPKQALCSTGLALHGHNDHRIVMALSVILSVVGGELLGVEAVKKSYPGFFEDIQRLGARVELREELS